MATDIPPHNIHEVASAVIALLENPAATLENLMEHVKGPDFPTEASNNYPLEDLRKMYKTGRESVCMRALWTVENSEAVIISLPYQVSSTKVLEQIAIQVRAKKLSMIENLHDESDHKNQTRLVIVPRSNCCDMMPVMHHLFATTDLERGYRVNMNMIGLNGRLELKNLNDILSEWLVYRRGIVRRRLNFWLESIRRRLYIITGLLVAYLNLDEVIHIIHSESEPKQILIQRFELSDIQG